MITLTTLRERRTHELRGCTLSPSGLIDQRCAQCVEFDRRLHESTRRGWEPTPADRKFLSNLRIARD